MGIPADEYNPSPARRKQRVRSGLISLAPVSYTHLDVYKRQALALDQGSAHRKLGLQRIGRTFIAQGQYRPTLAVRL